MGTPTFPDEDPNLLLVVEDSFDISGRGRVLAPGLPSTTKHVLKKGDPIRLVKPSGEASETVILGIEAVHSRRAEPPQVLFFLTIPRSVTAQEVPRGTRVLANPPRVAS